MPFRFVGIHAQLWHAQQLPFFSTRYGTASFCRTGTYGMPQFVTNTIRLCTKDAANATYDPYVPVKPLYGSAGTNPTFAEGDGDEMCSTSPTDVPWSMEDAAASENPASTFAVGSVPMWDGSKLSQNPFYPKKGVFAEQLANMDPGKL